MIKESPLEAKRMNKEMISKSVITLIFNAYIIKKRIHKKQEKSRSNYLNRVSSSFFFSYMLFISADHIYFLSKRQNLLPF